MKVGQTRTLKMFIPDLNKICDVTLTARTMEEIALGGGEKRSLLKVEQKTSLEGKPRPEFDMTCWVDAGGQVLKSVSEVMGGIVTYRTTMEAAVAEGTGKLDQILDLDHQGHPQDHQARDAPQHHLPHQAQGRRRWRS